MNKHKKLFSILLTAVFAFALFLVTAEEASAKSCKCGNEDIFIRPIGNSSDQPNVNSCVRYCQKEAEKEGKRLDYILFDWEEYDPSGRKISDYGYDFSKTLNYINPINWVLYGIFKLVSWLLMAMGFLFGWVVQAKNVNDIVGNQVFYDTWKIVRDFLNLGFILVLLFSAFSTVFQVEKYHLKNLWLMLGLMALLVNFSYPIARFIIDASNVLFYFVYNEIFQNVEGEGILASFLGLADFSQLVSIVGVGDDIVTLLAAIIFTFILTVSFGAISVMFVIRLAMLGILLAFASVGFVAAIFPGTKKYAVDWWTALFRYSFCVPLMLFMMAIVIKFLHELNRGNEAINSLKSITSNAGVDNFESGFIADIAYFAIPIVILWTVLIVAQRICGAGADMAVKKATNIGKKFSGYNLASRHIKRWGETRKSQAEERTRQRVDTLQGGWDKITGSALQKTSDSRFGRVANLFSLGGVSRSAKDRLKRSENTYNARVRDYMKDYQNNDNGAELARFFDKAKNEAEAEAIIRHAAATGNLDAIVSLYGYEVNAAGLANTVRKKFGDNDKAARLALSVGKVESSTFNNHHWLGVSGPDETPGKERYRFTDDLKYADGYAYRIGKMKDAIFGTHPQNAARKFNKDTIIVKNAATSAGVRFSEDFEAVLKSINDSDFKTFIDIDDKKGQLNQIPFDVIKAIQDALDKGATPERGGKTEKLINALKSKGRLSKPITNNRSKNKGKNKKFPRIK